MPPDTPYVQPARSEHGLRDCVADMLAENDAAGTGPLSRQEYLDDADALLALVAAHVSVHGTDGLVALHA